MDRRAFLAGTGYSVAGALLPHRTSVFAEIPASSAATLTIGSQRTNYSLPVNYTGLSYELAQMTEPAFFSEGHHDLIALCRTLSRNGVLRLGGNTSEFCWFQATPSTAAPKLVVPSGNLSANWMPHRLFAVQPQAIDNLAGFLRATGWRAIYGLNLGHSTPARAAVEAAYVSAKLGSHLLFFQIGNEPNYYGDAANGTRPAGWNFDDYAREWLAFAHAILAKVPDARFGGPDVGSTEWITRFGNEVAPRLPGRVTTLTGHYYAEGPPDDPRMTTDRLLAGDPAVAASMAKIEPVAKEHSLVYRMTEGNSCYRGGKPGMSDAFASALWAADYMLLLASLGCEGVNLHGGDSRFLSAGLGNHNPGLHTAAAHGKRQNGFYTPISTEQGQAARAMPIYYGMLLANQFAGAALLDANLQTAANITAYAADVDDSEKGCKVAVLNKDRGKSLSMTITSKQRFRRASVWRLRAPSLNATSVVTLGGSAVASDGSWHPHAESLVVNDGHTVIEVPAASGALIFLE
jgi:hypothetical protein